MSDNASSTCRCPWLDTSKPDYVAYHDEEWGVPIYDDNKIFEFLTLESAQAGLSWYTILKKRDGYRKAFANFDPNIVKTFDQDKVELLLQDAGIVRNRKKIEAAINNAACFLEVQKEFGSFSNYIWGFVEHKPIVTTFDALEDFPAKIEISDALAKDLKKRGFKFLGSTTVYAHMQAMGMVNDHSISCFRHEEVKALAK
ncbi:DNA-3-methyladenine glycosylase I [Flocculibacter collagenilyticus]|uniref:DNA-3-methyladenine glycosylase I n=1 Tax=Flocculibacter collagenilyticus TaxID=2744479 RepID=UPI0018F5A45A|nr:DNA-3-methyladenine glycosylase I [Flocculibacter collagenilyticus]